MDCSHARLLMVFHRPGQSSDLAAEDRVALESHLNSCPKCSAWFTQQTAVDRAISTAVQHVAIPATLADRLKSQAATRLKWAWRRKAVKYAMAASLLVAAYGAYIAITRPTLDVAGLADDQDRLWQAPARTAADWLVIHGLNEALPEPFDLQLVTFLGHRELQGRSTLAIRFDTTDRRMAWVYFVRSSHFNLRDASTGQYTSNVAVRVYRDLPGGWTAVVAYTGNNLNAFLRGPGSDA